MPDFKVLDRLKSQLLTSGFQEKNNPLFQIINQMIDFMKAVNAAIPNFNYNSGQWIPVIGGVTSETGQSYSEQTGTFIRIRNLVFTNFIATLTAKGTITGNIIIKGLPFTMIADRAVHSIYFASLADNWNYVAGRDGGSGNSYITLEGTQSADTDLTALTTSNISDTTTISGSILYQTVGF